MRCEHCGAEPGGENPFCAPPFDVQPHAFTGNHPADLREAATHYTMSFKGMRAANLSRCRKWHKGGLEEWSLSDWGVATAGEMGEALNVIKKLNRERDGIAGNTASVAELHQQLADEIADVAIYLDIMAASEGIDLAAAIAAKFNKTSEKVGFPERLHAPCDVCGATMPGHHYSHCYRIPRLPTAEECSHDPT